MCDNNFVLICSVLKQLKPFSCYTPIDGKPCGDCDACFRRVVALESNGIKTGIEISKRLKDSYMRDLHNYNKDYIKQVIEWYLDL
ncbi:MAG: 7-cyano-7-deazaguanine synthase [Abditibacteriota bacterium]|nr:7-cyano-7-deazaguanine synthase [Abditibacteriota bacterium]